MSLGCFLLGVFPWTRLPMLCMAPRSEDPKLIIRVINFELAQPICSRYVCESGHNESGVFPFSGVPLD